MSSAPNAPGASSKPSNWSSSSGVSATLTLDPTPRASERVQFSATGREQQQQLPTLRAAASVATSKAAVDTFDMSYAEATQMRAPDGNASLEEKMDFLQQQLDCVGTERPILDGLVLLGNGINERLEGGALLHEIQLSCNMHVMHA
jgi:hypothetical protein